MRNMKKILAIGLAAAMTLGGTVTAMASDPVTNGSSAGAGTSEGHVDEKATNVVLPTIASGSTPFAYIMDPEGLITETDAAAHAASQFPAANDTRVYFDNGPVAESDPAIDHNYLNTSPAQTVVNKSSHDISLTVTAAATTASTDIPLVAQSALENAEEASLYLGLKVGSEAAVAVGADTAATKTVTLTGTPANFKIAYESNAYVYRALTLAEYKVKVDDDTKTQDDYDATWASKDIQLEGATTEDLKVTSTTTAPTITVTWSWVDPSANYTVTYNANYENADPATATESVAAGSNPTGTSEAITALKNGYDGHTFAGWYDAATGGEEVDVTELTGATTVYAHWTESNVAPTIASGSKEVALEAGSPLEISINPGSGDYAATGIKSITLANGNTIPAARYTYADSTLTFDTTFVTNNRNAIGIGNSMEVTVTFTCDDETDRTDTFTFTVD